MGIWSHSATCRGDVDYGSIELPLLAEVQALSVRLGLQNPFPALQQRAPTAERFGADFLPDADDLRKAQQEVAEQLHVIGGPEDDLLEEQSLSSASWQDVEPFLRPGEHQYHGNALLNICFIKVPCLAALFARSQCPCVDAGTSDAPCTAAPSLPQRVPHAASASAGEQNPIVDARWFSSGSAKMAEAPILCRNPTRKAQADHLLQRE